MRKQFFNLVFLLTGFIISSYVNAQIAIAPSIGDGLTEGTAYQIETLENLYWLSQNSSNWDKYFIQMADIDASASSAWDSGNGWTPIGANSTRFTGNYNGNGFYVNGITLNRDVHYLGFFGYTTGATIQNLGITNADITANNGLSSLNTGALVGADNGSTFTKCYSTGSVSGHQYVGGLIGNNQGSTISECYSEATVTAYSSLGGLSGWLALATNVNDCYSTGSVTATALDHAWAGGFSGAIRDGSTMSNCYSTGSVNIESSANWDGGLIGVRYTNSTINHCFWDVETSGVTYATNNGSNIGMTGLSTAQMKMQSSFTNAGWDFVGELSNGTNDYWDIDANGINNAGYPVLSWQQFDNSTPSVPLSDCGVFIGFLLMAMIVLISVLRKPF